MNHQALARKWRPQKFTDLVGQTHVMQALQNALTQQRLHHAYLFTGTRGVGKTTIARLFAKSLNCETGLTANPCGICQNCVDIEKGCFIDLLEIDAASRTRVEDTRDLLDNVQYAPTRGRYKIYLIDEVHMLSNHSFNALLKTLEEPPPHVKFLLATTDPQKLPVTVLSRCLQFHLKNLPVDQITQHLSHVLEAEKISFEPAALHELARAADGSMRDALSLLDQAIATSGQNLSCNEVLAMLGISGKELLIPLLQTIIARDVKQALTYAAKLYEIAADFSYVLDALLSFLHRLSVLQLAPELADADNHEDQQLSAIAKQCGSAEIQLFYQSALLSKRDLTLAPSLQIGFEMALLRMIAFKPNSLNVSGNAPTKPATSAPPITSQTTAPLRQPNQSVATAPTVKSVAPPPRESKSTNQNNADSLPWDNSTPTTTKTAPVIPPVVDLPPVDTNNSVARPQDDPWSQAIPKLGLVAFTKALAENLSLISWGENQVHLALAEVHAPMLKDRHRQTITEALSKYAGKNLEVIIQVGAPDQPKHASPLEKKAQHQAADQHEALTRFNQDEVLQKTLAMYDGKILPETLQVEEKDL